MQPLLSDTLSAAKGRKHQQQEASNNHSQHTTNHSKSDDKIFAMEEKSSINSNDKNITTKQDYIPEIIIGVLANIITK
jgi:hypothetical protein